MTSNASPGTRILGSLRSADGAGVVRIEDRYATDIDDLWSAITDPDRLARWFGEVDGELSAGGRVPCAHRRRGRAHRSGGGVRGPTAPTGDDQGNR